MSDPIFQPASHNVAHVDAAIVGAGPAGLGAAVGLARGGVRRVVIIERRERAGGAPMLFEARGRPGLPLFGGRVGSSGKEAVEFIDDIQSQLAQSMAALWTCCHVVDLDPAGPGLVVAGPSKGRMELHANAVILACGAREASQAEHGWLTGRRLAGVLNGRQCLGLINRREQAPARRPIVAGADAAAAPVAIELARAAGAPARMIDVNPQIPFGLRRRLKQWGDIQIERLKAPEARIVGHERVEGLQPEGEGKPLDADLVVLSGALVPDTHLLVRARCPIALPGRTPRLKRNRSVEGTDMVFVVGAMTGEARDAEWCRRDGLALGRRLAPQLKRLRG